MKQQDKMFYLLDGMEMSKSEREWLEQRFANMTEKERFLFTGALELERPTQADRVMELADQLPCFDLYYGAGDDESLGRFVLEYLERPSSGAAPFLNTEQVGAAYRDQDKGVFCQGHYLRRVSLTVPRPEVSQLLQPVAGDYAIRVKLASQSNMDGVWVGFPDTGEHMDAACPDELLLGLDALQAETLQECIVLEADCCLSQLRSHPSMPLPVNWCAMPSTSAMSGRSRVRGNPTGWRSGRRCWNWRTAAGWIRPWTMPRISGTMPSSHAMWTWRSMAGSWPYGTVSSPRQVCWRTALTAEPTLRHI